MVMAAYTSLWSTMSRAKTCNADISIGGTTEHIHLATIEIEFFKTMADVVVISADRMYFYQSIYTLLILLDHSITG